MNTTILVIGNGGALGTAIRERAYEAGHTVVTTDKRLSAGSWEDHLLDIRTTHPGQVYVVNAAGILPGGDPVSMIIANALGPQMLARGCAIAGTRLIHVSSDCVYDETLPRYECHRASDTLRPSSLYGWTKAAGEPDYQMVLRTSFLTERHGFYRWIVDAAKESLHTGERIPVWAEARWSGSTVEAVAAVIITLIERDAWRPGKFNLATLQPVVKADLAFDIVQRRLGEDYTRALHRVDEPYVNRAMEPDFVLPPFEHTWLAPPADPYARAEE